jgi:hypothetical protein
MITISSGRYISGYHVEIRFSNGLTKAIDLEPELYGPLFAPLKDPSLFRQVSFNPDTHTIEWPNGADLAPERLYELALATSKESAEGIAA